MKNSEEKKKFKLIDLIKNKQYYAIANLVFYFCLILVLIIGVRMSPSSSNSNSSLNNSNENTIQSDIEGYSNIKNKNYNFKYILSIDDVKTEYAGKQRENKILFTDKTNNKEYFMQDNIVLVKENDKFVLSDFKTQYFNYFDVDVIEEILSLSTKDEDEYVITVKNFEKIISSKETVDNSEIYIKLYKTNNIITKIVFDLTEYVNISNNDIDEVSLEIEYSNFNLIEEFDVTK